MLPSCFAPYLSIFFHLHHVLAYLAYFPIDIPHLSHIFSIYFPYMSHVPRISAWCRCASGSSASRRPSSRRRCRSPPAAWCWASTASCDASTQGADAPGAWRWRGTPSGRHADGVNRWEIFGENHEKCDWFLPPNIKHLRNHGSVGIFHIIGTI